MRVFVGLFGIATLQFGLSITSQQLCNELAPANVRQMVGSRAQLVRGRAGHVHDTSPARSGGIHAPCLQVLKHTCTPTFITPLHRKTGPRRGATLLFLSFFL